MASPIIKLRLFTLVSDFAIGNGGSGSDLYSLLRSSGGDLSLSLLHGIHEQLLGLEALCSKEILIGEKLSEVHKLLINEHASNAAGKLLSESALDDGVDGITDEILSAFWVGHRNGIKLSNVDLRQGKESHWLLLGNALLAVVTLGKVSLVVTTSSASSTTVSSSAIALMVGVALLISTLVSTIVVSTLIAVATLVLVRDTH